MRIQLKSRRITEANIQAEFYHHCRELRIPCYLEYTHENCRFDAVIFDHFTLEIIAIVEFKSKIKDSVNFKTKQLDKYRKHNLPIILINKINRLEDGMLEILRILWRKCDNIESKKEIHQLAELYKMNKDLTIFFLERRLLNRYENTKISYKNDKL